MCLDQFTGKRSFTFSIWILHEKKLVDHAVHFYALCNVVIIFPFTWYIFWRLKKSFYHCVCNLTMASLRAIIICYYLLNIKHCWLVDWVTAEFCSDTTKHIFHGTLGSIAQIATAVNTSTCIYCGAICNVWLWCKQNSFYTPLSADLGIRWIQKRLCHVDQELYSTIMVPSHFMIFLKYHCCYVSTIIHFELYRSQINAFPEISLLLTLLLLLLLYYYHHCYYYCFLLSSSSLLLILSSSSLIL